MKNRLIQISDWFLTINHVNCLQHQKEWHVTLFVHKHLACQQRPSPHGKTFVDKVISYEKQGVPKASSIRNKNRRSSFNGAKTYLQLHQKGQIISSVSISTEASLWGREGEPVEFFFASPEFLRSEREIDNLSELSQNKVPHNDNKLIMNYQVGPSESFWINLISFRTFRRFLFQKPDIKVCSVKKLTKRSTVLLLRLVSFFTEQTLVEHFLGQDRTLLTAHEDLLTYTCLTTHCTCSCATYSHKSCF